MLSSGCCVSSEKILHFTPKAFPPTPYKCPREKINWNHQIEQLRWSNNWKRRCCTHTWRSWSSSPRWPNWEAMDSIRHIAGWCHRLRAVDRMTNGTSRILRCSALSPVNECKSISDFKITLLWFLCHSFGRTWSKGTLTWPRLKGRLFCVHFISVSGTEPLTMHVKLYSISDISCFGLTLIFTESGLTAGKREEEGGLN